MDKIKKTLTKEYQLPFKVNESLISMVLGIVVVLLTGLIAYNYFRTHKEAPPVMTNVDSAKTDVIVQDKNQRITPKPIEGANKNVAPAGKVGQGASAVALPAVHTVASGETLWAIAEKYYNSGFNYVDLAKANNIANASQIAVGQKLTIPKTEVRQPITVAGAKAPTITTSRIEGGLYTVVKGDSVWDISLRAYGDGYRFNQIVAANKLSHPNLIHPGNKLTIPR